MKLISMILFLFLFAPARADDGLTISFSDVSRSNAKYSRKIAGLPNNLAVTGTFAWSYLRKKGAIVLANEVEPNSPKSCVLFSISDATELIFGSDPRQSCRIIGEPQVRKKDTTLWVFIPVEIDPSGNGENYISGGINLLLDKTKESLCSTEGANAEWMCRRQVSENF